MGRIQAKLPTEVAFFVMSDHGFHSFRRGVNLNTWLVQNGYQVFQGQQGQTSRLADLVGRGKFFDGVDWSRTKAYAVGLGQIYFNLRGREEPRGSWPRGRSTRRCRTRSRAQARGADGPGQRREGVPLCLPAATTSTRANTCRTPPTCRSASTTATAWAGRTPSAASNRAVVENNTRKWSGDHCATATEISSGVLFSNRKINTDVTELMDLSPTVLKLLEVPLPADLDGKPLM